MNFYKCEIKRKSEVIENCNDNSFIIVDEQPMDNYDDVTHLVAFMIGDNIYNVCNSGDHGAAYNCLQEKFKQENPGVIFCEKGKYWKIHYVDNSIEHLKLIQEFLLKIENKMVDESYIDVDSINMYVKGQKYKKENFRELIGALKMAIHFAEEKQKEDEAKEEANQMEARKKHSIIEGIKRKYVENRKYRN